MSQQSSGEIHRPRTDDRPLWDVVLGLYGYPAVLLAHRLKLFPLLAEKPRTLPEVCAALHVARRPAETLLSVCASLGLLQVQGGCYSLTPVAEDYLLDSSPTYFGGELDLTIANASVWSLESLEKAVRTDTAQVYGGGREMFQSHAEQAELARAFTRAVHSTSMGPALAWPDTLDLSGHRLMLDVGGGSGAHCIGAARRWPTLQAVVFDAPPVCEVAEEFIARDGLQGRIRTQVGDILVGLRRLSVIPSHPHPGGGYVAGPLPDSGSALLFDDLSRLAAGEVPVSDPEELPEPGAKRSHHHSRDALQRGQDGSLPRGGLQRHDALMDRGPAIFGG